MGDFNWSSLGTRIDQEHPTSAFSSFVNPMNERNNFAAVQVHASFETRCGARFERSSWSRSAGLGATGALQRSGEARIGVESSEDPQDGAP